ncbi:uncharacterized protein LOC129588011 [Paramacrobiotus metropolitanus]|uniref:uncharacterized protein LOC129588011 n=1 Tax=Paramacrobiotus metropolitanus TaxID=2943436 RepID=UPI0024460EDB|nr:uncharacterized protein LOC129588011 [Paramacrobiotus metropolitanus]
MPADIDTPVAAIRLRMLLTVGLQSVLNAVAGITVIVLPPLIIQGAVPISLYCIGGVLLFFALLGLFWIYRIRFSDSKSHRFPTIFPTSQSSESLCILVIFKRYTYSLLCILLLTFIPVLIQIPNDIVNRRVSRLIEWPIFTWAATFFLNLACFIGNVVMAERYAERLKRSTARRASLAWHGGRHSRMVRRHRLNRCRHCLPFNAKGTIAIGCLKFFNSIRPFLAVQITWFFVLCVQFPVKLLVILLTH